MKKHKPTLKSLVTAAHKAGVKVSVSLKPVETSLEPLRLMVEDLTAIYRLCQSRNIDSIEAARRLSERISRNQILLITANLERDYWAKDILDRP